MRQPLWIVFETRSAAKQLSKLPFRVQLIYQELVQDLEKEGPYPNAWDALPLQGRDGIRIRLNREYRVIIEVQRPNILVIKVAHRKEVYK